MSDAYARRLDAVLAGHRGDAATAEQFLTDDDAAVRAAALGALERCEALRAEHVVSALTDMDAQVRCRAAELAPDDIELVHLLDDNDATVVEAAAAALGERHWDASPVSKLCDTAQSHDDPLCRESAIAALGAIAAGMEDDSTGDMTEGAATGGNTTSSDMTGGAAVDHGAARALAFEVLLAAMEDRPQIRRRALLGLHQFDDERAVAAVQSAIDDNDRQVRAVAGELLGVPVR